MSGEMGIVGAGVHKISLDDINFDENDLETIIHVRSLAWLETFEKHKAYKKI